MADDEKKVEEIKPPFRELEELEIEALFAIYDKNNGNISAMTRDAECQFKDWHMIAYWSNKYNLSPRYHIITRERAENYKQSILSRLEGEKLKSVEQAFWLMMPRKIKRLIPLIGTEVEEMIYPTAKDISTAWQIIKTELGEPTTITKNTNFTVDDPDTVEALNRIKDLSNAYKRPENNEQPDAEVIQGERPATDNPASV